MYCVSCRTSVAQAELDDRKETSLFNDIIFKDQVGSELVIGTTRPELLPSCVALLFNPNDARYIHLQGRIAHVPLFDFSVPILPDDQVQIDKGTGLVMCCTFGDTTDVEWYKKHGFEFKRSIGFDGKFATHIPHIGGLSVRDAREKIIDLLKEAGLLIKQSAVEHVIGIHERCKNPIEYTVLPQWFVRIVEYKDQFIKLADSIQWAPSFMKHRYIDWVKNLGWDWCISRQRFFGIPFPAWHCASCCTIMIADPEELPLDPEERIPSKPCIKCGGTDFIPDTDVMDTWNTSALTPYIVAELYTKHTVTFGEVQSSLHDFLPLSMRPQAHDIIRTWAFYSITRAWMHDDSIPWSDIVISGHVLAGSKEKLSKSQNNAALAPHTLIERYSADVVRYWTASGALGQDTAFSETQLKIGQKLVTKLWNAFKFIAMHSTDYAYTEATPKSLGLINEWILHAGTLVFERYKNAFDIYEFSEALQHIEQFFWNDFCDNYLELIKDLLFNPDTYTAEHVNATKWTLHHVGLRVLQLYAPFIPHVTEQLYQMMFTSERTAPSLHGTQFQEWHHHHGYAESAVIMKQLLDVVASVRRLKSEHELSLKTEIAQLMVIVTDESYISLLEPHLFWIKGVTGARIITCESGDKEDSHMTRIDEHWYARISL